MIRPYVIVQVVTGGGENRELAGQYQPSPKGLTEAKDHVARLNEKYGERFASIHLFYCTREELEGCLEYELTDGTADYYRVAEPAFSIQCFERRHSECFGDCKPFSPDKCECNCHADGVGE